jgi:hypothetical protein
MIKFQTVGLLDKFVRCSAVPVGSTELKRYMIYQIVIRFMNHCNDYIIVIHFINRCNGSVIVTKRFTLVSLIMFLS